MSAWSVLLLHSPALCRCVHPGEIPRFIYSAVLSLSPFTHALLNCSAHQFKAADPERLQHSSYLLQPSELQQPDHTVCERLRTVSDWWDWAYERRAARIYGNPGLCISPGVLLWWTTLQMSVTSGLGSLPKGWRCQHAPSSPLPRCDDCSLACTGKKNKKNPVTTSAAPVTCLEK